MRKQLKLLLGASAIALAISLPIAEPSYAASAALQGIMFQDSTGLQASDAQIQSTWEALKQMGTTAFLGGMVGSFKLDESSMIAGALTIGVTEFDNYLRTGSLGALSGSAGGALSSAMSSAAGINLSSLVGSYTSGGGTTGSGGFDATSAASGAGGICDPGVATDLVNIGKKHVEIMRDVALGDEYGVSTIGSLAGPSGKGVGFASLGCLDKLFQNAGSDILFKPPSLGNLLGQLQNWTCPKFPSVSEQVMGGFGDLSSFDTASMGGFFPSKTYGEANDGEYSPKPGIGNSATTVFGDSFGKVQVVSSSQVSALTDLKRLFQ